MSIYFQAHSDRAWPWWMLVFSPECFCLKTSRCLWTWTSFRMLVFSPECFCGISVWNTHQLITDDVRVAAARMNKKQLTTPADTCDCQQLKQVTFLWIGYGYSTNSDMCGPLLPFLFTLTSAAGACPLRTGGGGRSVCIGRSRDAGGIFASSSTIFFRYSARLRSCLDSQPNDFF